ncbi:MAG TPA: hypothetical protein VGC84_12765 [Ilumatobacteraceae bacterium]|jgi:hypothetical protein
MSIKRRVKSVIARSGVAVGDFHALQRDVQVLAGLVQANASVLHDLNRRSGGVDIRHEFDSLATAHAEAMVYLNRSLREIRSEMLSITAAVGRLEENLVADKRA